MPATMLSFRTDTCNATFEFGQQARNTIVWAPHGRFLVLGGFGSLAGAIDFWVGSSFESRSLHVNHYSLFSSHLRSLPYQVGSNHVRFLSNITRLAFATKHSLFIRSFSSLFLSFSEREQQEGDGKLYQPYSTFFLLSNTHDLLHVPFLFLSFQDVNKKKAMGSSINRDGPRHYEFSPDSRLFASAAMRPQRSIDNGVRMTTYYGEEVATLPYDRLWQFQFVPTPPAVEYPDRPQSPRLSDKRVKKAAAATAAAAKPKAAYVPPHMRGQQQASNSVAAAMRAEVVNTGPRRVGANAANNPYAGMTKNQIKAAKKKEREKRKKLEAAAEEAAAASSETTTTSSAGGGDKTDKEAATKSYLASEEAATKRIKAITKKLKQISALRSRVDVDGHVASSDEQTKLDSEAALSAEMNELQMADW
jgi:translation initiation factor 2A